MKPCARRRASIRGRDGSTAALAEISTMTATHYALVYLRSQERTRFDNRTAAQIETLLR
jgi:hypothetical protein